MAVGFFELMITCVSSALLSVHTKGLSLAPSIIYLINVSTEAIKALT
jgi:hypothetical protein